MKVNYGMEEYTPIHYSMPDVALIGNGDGDRSPMSSKFGQNRGVVAVFLPLVQYCVFVRPQPDSIYRSSGNLAWNRSSWIYGGVPYFIPVGEGGGCGCGYDYPAGVAAAQRCLQFLVGLSCVPWFVTKFKLICFKSRL